MLLQHSGGLRQPSHNQTIELACDPKKPSMPSSAILSRVFVQCLIGALAVACLMPGPGQAALLDPMLGTVLTPGSAGLGVAVRTERSPYRDVNARYDVLPLYMYDGERIYLHSYRAGLKLKKTGAWHADMFFSERFEGFPSGERPGVLAGMATREPGVDFGLGFQYLKPGGAYLAEVRRDISNASEGLELRLGYFGAVDGERFSLTPYAVVAIRDSALNDYYYGVRPNEARPGRPALTLGYGINLMLGLNGRYELTENWRAVFGIGVTRMAETIRDSPIVGNDSLISLYAGAVYDFQPAPRKLAERPPFIVKALVGGSTDCNLLPIMTLQCLSLDTPDRTRIAAIEFGQRFVEGLNGWPLDFVGFVGFLYRDERGYQPDNWQLNAYMKAYYYGFPWSHRVRTRVGFGAGVSWAAQVPYVEVRDQDARARTTSKLLNYLDPSIDVNVGDVFGSKRWSDTYFGVGVSHRSGIFGASRLFGNVDGGSNFLYTYIETSF